jgi:dienelactone hydrolase
MKPARRAPPLATVLFLLVAAAAALPAQEWQGRGRAHGVVLGPDEEPLPGARVTLTPEGWPAGEPSPVTPVRTGQDGRWAVTLLAAGVWGIAVEAEGHHPAEGTVVVPAEGPGRELTIELRSLEEVSPSSAESDPAWSVRRWLKEGDAFLAQGRPAEARAEYEKALRTPGVLGPVERAQLLETVARTRFLEGDRGGAERALLAALLLAPGEERLRELYAALLDGESRGAEARALLDRLDREPAVVRAELDGELVGLLAPPEEEAPGPEEPERPVLAPEAHRRGRYRTALAERSPLSDPAVVVPRYGGTEEDARRLDPEGRYDLARETFEVYVPEGYAPASGSAPGYGLLVWVSPNRSGGVERPELRALLDQRRLVWVGANRAGNPRATWVRAGLALDAARAMTGLYDLDPERIYVAGYSGGGRLASQLAMLFPEVFRGALSLYGASFFRPVPVPDRPGHHWPPAFPEPPAETLRRLRRECRLVLVTGERDFNRAQTRAFWRALAADGFERVTYVEVPGASHYEPFDDLERLRGAFEALDASPQPGSR